MPCCTIGHYEFAADKGRKIPQAGLFMKAFQNR